MKNMTVDCTALHSGVKRGRRDSVVHSVAPDVLKRTGWPLQCAAPRYTDGSETMDIKELIFFCVCWVKRRLTDSVVHSETPDVAILQETFKPRNTLYSL